MTGRDWLGLVSSVSVALAGTSAAAQTVTPAPAPPQSIPSREQVEQPRPTQPQPSRLRIDARRALASAPCPLTDSDLKVSIDRLTFSGAGGAPLAPELQQILAPIAAPGASQREIAVVCELRDQANARLSAAGYIASVQIPPQRIEAGELKLEVITAKIVEMRVRGDAPPYRRALEARAEKLKQIDPLNQRDAERVLLAANDIPGLDVQLSLSPAGTKAGEVIGELTVFYRPFSVLANVNNFGSKQLGPVIGYVRAEAYGLLGNQDFTYIGGSASADFKEQRVVQAGHGGAIGKGGTRFEISALHAWSRPDLDTLDLRSKSLVGNFTLTQPLVLSRRRRAAVSTGLEIIEQRTRVYSAGSSSALNRDKLRVAFLRAEGDMRAFGNAGTEIVSLGASAEVRKGLDILDATKKGEVSPSGYTPSRFEGDPEAFVFRGGLDALLNGGGRASLLGRVRAQWTNKPLLNFEEFSIGTLTIGRGYDPGSNSGDRALGLRLEPRFALVARPTFRLESFLFGDRVYLRNLDTGSPERKRTLDSYGGGLRALLPGFGYLEAMYARPRDVALLLPDAKRAPDRFLLSLTAQFPRGGR